MPNYSSFHKLIYSCSDMEAHLTNSSCAGVCGYIAELEKKIPAWVQSATNVLVSNKIMKYNCLLVLPLYCWPTYIKSHPNTIAVEDSKRHSSYGLHKFDYEKIF
jgi:hypothetical protein